MQSAYKVLPPLYKKSSSGKVQQWEISVFDNHDGTAYTRVTHGQVDGKKQTTDVKYTEGKNTGRANATNALEQALSEGRSKWNKQKDKGYVEDPTGVGVRKAPLPMLAYSFKDYSKQVTYPCYSQPKLDGCVSGETLLETLEYGKINIQQVVEEKLDCHVKSYNIKQNKIEYKKVKSFFKDRTLLEKVDWFELELENGKILTITGNHRVYIPDKQCWRRVDELDGSENLMVI